MSVPYCTEFEHEPMFLKQVLLSLPQQEINRID
ncbi:MAG: hypothetical protein KatS3mg056_0060 [Chloroflexus sp.]|nr:MAG: hypothetical protein KatS3mg056_0060 [Chloroflexus sp.]